MRKWVRMSAVLCSWLGKIQVVKELLVDTAEKARPGLDALAYAYIYLQVTSLFTLTPSLARSLAHSFTHSFSHLLAHSLTCSRISSVNH